MWESKELYRKNSPKKLLYVKTKYSTQKLDEWIRKEEQKKIKYSANLKIFNLGILASENWKLNYCITGGIKSNYGALWFSGQSTCCYW